MAYAVGVVGVLVFIYLATAGPTPPLTYTQTEYRAERSEYAPGETLVYSPSLEVARAGEFDIRRGWRIKPSGVRARLCDGTNAPTTNDTPPGFPQEVVGQSVSGRVPVVVPNLPPGTYWLVSTATKKDGGEAITVVSVTITQPCKG